MIHCTHCGSTDGPCDWIATDAGPPCRAAAYYNQTQLTKEGWRIFKTLLGIEAGVLTLVILFAFVAF
jgi:hypothetical protein